MTYSESASVPWEDMTHPAIPPSRHPFPPFQLRRGDVLIFVPGAYEYLGSPSRRWIRRQHVHMEEEKSSSQLPLKGIIIHIYIYVMDTLTSLEGRCFCHKALAKENCPLRYFICKGGSHFLTRKVLQQMVGACTAYFSKNSGFYLKIQ